MGVETMGGMPLLQLPPLPRELPSILYTMYRSPLESLNPAGSIAPPWETGHAIVLLCGVYGPRGVLDVAAPTQCVVPLARVAV